MSAEDGDPDLGTILFLNGNATDNIALQQWGYGYGRKIPDR